MYGAPSRRERGVRTVPVAASYLRAGNHFPKFPSTVKIDAAQDVLDGHVILEWLGQVTERPNIITLALIGAGLSALGADAVARRLRIEPWLARWLLRCGYTAMWASVALFIVAGFLPAG